MAANVEHFDVVVIGGGPAGSTAATFIAMQGHRVLLIDKETFPTYKIGESLLPATIHGICAMLGVTEEIKQANFVHKRGGTFRWGKKKEPWTFSFSQSSKIESPTSYAYQVERMKFDLILLNNARRKGVDVRERNKVIDVIFEGDRVAGIEFEDQTGAHRIARARYVVDASGHSSVLARHTGDRIYSQFFQNVAVFGYYRNGKRLPEPASGNIFSCAFEKGWFWYIPLSPTLTSVGAVIGHEHSAILRQGPPEALTQLIGECGHIKDMLSEASRITEGVYGEVRVRKDYSYCHTKFWRPGLVLIGDSACFVDPVFSSGVHLATYSALLAARSINTQLRNGLSEEKVFTEFERRYRREYRYFYDFLIAFYDMDQDLDGYYWAARKVMNSKEQHNEAFIQLVAGVAGSGETLYSNPREFMEARNGIGARLFPAAEGLSSDMSVDSVQDAERGKFMENLMSELVQIQLQGTFKNTPKHAVPLLEEGLVPSRDGFHWAESKKRRVLTTA